VDVLILGSIHHVQNGIASIVIGAFAVVYGWRGNHRLAAGWLNGLFGQAAGRLALSALVALWDLLGLAMSVLGFLSIAGVV
jgi:hypothetical protein